MALVSEELQLPVPASLHGAELQQLCIFYGLVLK